ncbi:MAG: DUF2306 domain-containing protein [Bacteroidia bacterium]
MSSSILDKVLFRAGWALLTLGAVYLIQLTVTYFSFCSDCNFLLKKQDVVFNPFWRTAFYIHITGGIIAVATGPFQFLGGLRRRFPKLHRRLGWAYVISILGMAGPSGQLMAFYSEGGNFSTLGFLIMAFLWLWTTWMALATAKKRDLGAHRDWMVRSFALSLAAVTLRLYVPAASMFMGWDQNFVVESSAWVSWIPNLIIAEVLVRKKLIKF